MTAKRKASNVNQDLSCGTMERKTVVRSGGEAVEATHSSLAHVRSRRRCKAVSHGSETCTNDSLANGAMCREFCYQVENTAGGVGRRMDAAFPINGVVRCCVLEWAKTAELKTCCWTNKQYTTKPHIYVDRLSTSSTNYSSLDACSRSLGGPINR